MVFEGGTARFDPMLPEVCGAPKFDRCRAAIGAEVGMEVAAEGVGAALLMNGEFGWEGSSMRFVEAS